MTATHVPDGTPNKLALEAAKHIRDADEMRVKGVAPGEVALLYAAATAKFAAAQYARGF